MTTKKIKKGRKTPIQMKFPINLSGAYWLLMKKLNATKVLKPLTNLIDQETYRNPHIQRMLMFVAFVTLTALILNPSSRMPSLSYKIGDFSTTDIKANRDYLITDKVSTNELREEAAAKIPAVYDLDVNAQIKLFDRIDSSFGHMREIVAETQQDDKVDSVLDQSRSHFFDLIGAQLPDETFLELKRQRFKPQIDTAVRLILDGLYTRYIVGSYNTIVPEIKKNGVVIINNQTKSEVLLRNADDIIELNDAKELIEERSSTLRSSFPGRIVSLAQDVAIPLIGPNVTFSFLETDRRRRLAAEGVKPVTISIKKGEMIIREGAKVLKYHLMIFDGIMESQKDYNILLAYIGILLFIGIVVYSTYLFSTRNIKKFNLSNKDLLLIGIVALLFCALTRFFIFISGSVADTFTFIPDTSYKYAMPIVAGAMLVRIVLNSEVAVIYSILVSIFSGIIIGGDIFFTIYIFIGSILGSHLVAQTKQRSTIVNAGLIVGLINAFLIFVIYLSRLNLLSTDILSSIGSDFKTITFNMIMGFAGGIISSVIVLGVTPLVELAFGYITDIKLVELSNLEHPLLKEMIITAPGTYHHSIIVGTLAEAGSNAIGVNPLLARVSSYYHDIGKISKPNYYIENIRNERNPHDKLTPHMSGLIIMSHVKDGVDMGKKYRLGSEIIDIIKQHHGTHLMNFFYQKARESENAKERQISEKDFRYPGPKPQTREAGIVLLADNVEAASKVLIDPSPSRVESMVQSIINRLFLDGQLDQCELTLKDLDAIGKSFTKVLNGIFHQRIDYPEPVIDKEFEESMREKNNGDSAPYKREAPAANSRKNNNHKDTKNTRPSGKGHK
ncbi:MAG: HDIG domain-containing protein [Deltaproteobacteria bacterium]|nr:HDIG domain-containing protein [Candidatus Zymogenaceae bacterium]